MKYALLDTDFVSKANIIQADEDHVLADRVLEFPNYVFVCHDFMIEELSGHGKRSAQEWLNRKISDGDMHKYSDGDILEMLSEVLGDECCFRYMTYLKRSCDAFATVYFEDKYASLITKGLSDAVGIPCISIIAVFMKMKNMGISKEEADTYFSIFSRPLQSERSDNAACLGVQWFVSKSQS